MDSNIFDKNIENKRQIDLQFFDDEDSIQKLLSSSSFSKIRQ